MVRRKKQWQTVPHGRKQDKIQKLYFWLYILNFALILFFLLYALRSSLPLVFLWMDG